MSTTNTHPTETYQCETCGGQTPAHAIVAGSFCSTECYARHRGQKLLNILEHDHRFCFTCFARLKTTERPSEQWTMDKASRVKSALDQGGEFAPGPRGRLVLDATRCEYNKTVDIQQIIGFQYGTKDATRGVIEDQIDDYLVIEREGLICTCGNTHHRNRETVIQHSDIKVVARNLLHSLEVLRREGVHDKHIDPHRLIQSLRDQVGNDEGDGWDFALAVGHAIQTTQQEDTER